MQRLGMHFARDIIHRGEPFVLYELDRSQGPLQAAQLRHQPDEPPAAESSV
jgi:hypothetical protein